MKEDYQALIRNYQWFLDNKDCFINASGASHRVPWGILLLVKLFFKQGEGNEI
jgi:hypothetical protein